MRVNFFVIFLCTLLFMQCSNPFDTDLTDPDDILKLTADFDEQYRLITTMPVYLSWSDIPIDYYQKTRILRYNQHRDIASYPKDSTNNGWITLTEFENSFITSYKDIITDDAVFTYRVELVDQDDNYKRGETEVTIRPTRHLIIPDDMDSVKTTVESYLIDSGDSVFIRPGEYYTNAFSFFGKNIYLQGLGGADKTKIRFWPRIKNDKGDILPDTTFIDMTDGTIRGLTIMGAQVISGGGIRARGTAIVKQCVILNNNTNWAENYGKGGMRGGGIYASGRVQINNCLLYRNSADYLGDGIYVDEFAEDVQIINCTLFENDIVVNSPNVEVRNCIVTAPSNAVRSIRYVPPIVKYTLSDLSWYSIDPTNLSGDPKFLNPPENFELAPSSPCIDSGDPSAKYNDKDGSRNDMGAYGGPNGKNL